VFGTHSLHQNLFCEIWFVTNIFVFDDHLTHHTFFVSKAVLFSQLEVCKAIWPIWTTIPEPVNHYKGTGKMTRYTRTKTILADFKSILSKFILVKLSFLV
jgi:hypothetical protein